MAAGVTVLVMSVVVSVLMGMSGRLVAVLVAVMSMRRRFVGVFMVVFVPGMAAHRSSLPALFFSYFNSPFSS